MSCWVVPAVAAEYWGVSIDAVWGRIHCELVPHKAENGFVFIDVDPWTPDRDGLTHHEPPATFVPADQTADPILDCDPPVLSGGGLDPAESALLRGDSPEEQDHSPDDEASDELPPLDDEESAAFTRLSWQEVRQRVGRMRKPPRAVVTSSR